MKSFVKYSIKHSFIIFLILFTYSCREPFEINAPDSDEKILVVEGTITDDYGVYTVKLSQAVPFGKTNHIPVKKATVYVMDDLNNKYDYKEKSNGVYYSDSATFRGQMGRSYTLYVKTSDGLDYKSNPCMIGPKSTIDSLYGYNERFLLMPAGNNENDVDIYANGLHVYSDISFGVNQRISTRLDAKLATRNQIVEWHYIGEPTYKIILVTPDSIIRVPDGGTTPVDSYEIVYTFYYTQLINLMPILKTNSDYKTGSKISKIPLEYVYGTTSNDTIDSTIFISGGEWIFILEANTISNETFNYYYNLLTQIDSKNSFFEPIPVQLNGNIKCITDSTRLVFGLFQANSVAKKYIHIKAGNKYAWEPADKIPAATRDSIHPTGETKKLKWKY
jgi:hypothetical protein